MVRASAATGSPSRTAYTSLMIVRRQYDIRGYNIIQNPPPPPSCLPPKAANFFWVPIKKAARFQDPKKTSCLPILKLGGLDSISPDANYKSVLIFEPTQ